MSTNVHVISGYYTIACTKTGWMDATTFAKFIDHFDKNAGTERPVVLLIDSVSSHIDILLFSDARSKGIELYRIIPNATHVNATIGQRSFWTSES